jgi:type I restriction enzyme S subunit
MELIQDTYKDTKIGRIPKDWDCKPMNDFVINFRGGASFKPNEFSNEGVKVLSKIGVRSSGVMTIPYSKQQFCEEVCLKKYAKSIATQSELVTVLRDLVPSGPSIGYIVKIPDNSAYIMAQGVYCFSVDENKINQNFLIQLSNTNWYRKYMQKILVGSTQVHIRGPVFLKTPLPLPTLPEQQKIAAILSTVDEQISTTDKIIEKSKELKKGLMQKLFSEGIGHTEFKDTKIGRIPKDWEVVRLKKLLSKPTEYGANASAIDFNENTYRYVRITDIHSDGRLNKTGIVGILREEGKKYLLNQDDVIIARTGNTVGKSYLYNITDGDCAYAGYLIRFVVNKDVLLPKYLFQYLQSNFFWNWVKRIVRTGAQPNINSKEYQSMRIPLPKLSDQNKIVEILSEADAKIEKEQEQKTKLEQLKKGLMQQLLTGKKRVKV